MVKSLIRVLRGEAVSPPPIWLMRQAGRYLPEYRALRAKAPDFIQFCLTPDLATEVTLQPVRRFDLDAAILFADILLVPHALGQKVWFADGEGPRLEPLRDRTELRKLAYRPELLAPVMEAIKAVRAELPERAALIGFAGAPWTVATYMIEGMGGTKHAIIRALAEKDWAFFGPLMDALVEASSAYLIAQADAGAQVLQLFESWAATVPDALWAKAVLEPTARIVKNVKAKHSGIPIIGFPRGRGAIAAGYSAATGVDGVGIDQMTDITSIKMPAGIALQGNLSPEMLLAGGAPMRAEAKKLVTAMAGKPFIFNLGHGVLQPTPPEHVAELVAAVRGCEERRA
jgi:uroporphyrinogen decarboxylase